MRHPDEVEQYGVVGQCHASFLCGARKIVRYRSLMYLGIRVALAAVADRADAHAIMAVNAVFQYAEKPVEARSPRLHFLVGFGFLRGPFGCDIRYAGVADRQFLVNGYVEFREEAFAGESVEKYPDIVFELKDTYGVDRTLYCGTLGMTTTHKKVSGGHAQFGVFMLHNSERSLPERDLRISEVFPTVLEVLGLGG